MNTNSTSTEHTGRGRWIAAAVIALVVIIAIVLLGHTRRRIGRRCRRLLGVQDDPVVDAAAKPDRARERGAP